MHDMSIVFNELDIAATQHDALLPRVQAVRERWENQPTDAAEYLALMLETERVAKLVASASGNDRAVQEAVEDAEHHGWADIPQLPCDPALQERLGEKMLEQVGVKPTGAIASGKHVLIQTALNNRRAVETAVQYCLDQGIPLEVRFDDVDFDTALINALPNDRIKTLASFDAYRFRGADPHLIFGENHDPERMGARDAAKFELYSHGAKENRNARVHNELAWILTKLPNATDAARDGFDSYGAYLDYFFDVLEQPYGDIFKAQAKLIPHFNAGHELHFTNDDGTDVRVRIDGMKFANSAPGRNLPGSEFFSGPSTVDGRVVAKGKFAYELDGRMLEMRDLNFTFENGRVVAATAGEGQENLDAILNRDEGARRVGEIGIGSNPAITRHLVNGLLVEKISGSFHLALGKAYGDQYLDQDVRMDNGNKSDVHWDITTMLRGKGGRMRLDGKLLQDNGQWLPVPEFGIEARDVVVLNEGWKAISESRRPAAVNARLATAEAAPTR